MRVKKQQYSARSTIVLLHFINPVIPVNFKVSVTLAEKYKFCKLLTKSTAEFEK